MVLKRLNNIFRLVMFKLWWKQKNKHNFTTVARVFVSNKVKIGNMTYGSLHIYTYGDEKERLNIGNYVSIAEEVKFILGGNHNINTFSTYPFKVMVLGEKSEAWSKGEIKIGDDVWIGMNAIILSGVIIGKGAIIGAGSVVSKNIPPYAIAAGNPAKVIKYRFSDEIKNEISKTEYSKINYNFVKDNIEKLYEPLNKENMNELMKSITNI